MGSIDVQDRIVSKLNGIVGLERRDPDDFIQLLAEGTFSKLRIRQYRLACVVDHDKSVLEVHRIEHRSGAYTADD